MKPKWQKLASLAQEICTFKLHFFGAVFASKEHPFKNIFDFVSAVPDSDHHTVGAATWQNHDSSPSQSVIIMHSNFV